MESEKTILWHGHEVSQAITGQASSLDWQAFGVSIDSRTLQKGDLFFAILGPNYDGHDYVSHALEKGACAVVVSKMIHTPTTYPYILVQDTLQALTQLGRYARKRANQARIIAITGSVGKTSIKEALSTVLSSQGLTASNVGSYNNLWGVPLSLARMHAHTQYGIFEIGTNHPGEIQPLAQLVRPHIALITHIAPAHQGFFSSEEAIAFEKSHIVYGLEPNGIMILPRDSAHYPLLFSQAKKASIPNILSFGRHEEANFRLLSCDLEATHSHVKALFQGQEYSYKLSLPGQHRAFNSTALIAITWALGCSMSNILPIFETLVPLKGRGLSHHILFQNKNLTIIDECYNANPTSVKAAIACLGLFQPRPPGRRIAILGTMAELGENAARYHLALSEPLKLYNIQGIFVCGPELFPLYENIEGIAKMGQALDAESLIPSVLKSINEGDIIMIKGGRFMKMERLIRAFCITETI